MFASKILRTGCLAGRSGRGGGLLLILLSALTLATTNASAQTSTTLYSFTGANGDGTEPIAGLIADSSGNLYLNLGQGTPVDSVERRSGNGMRAM